MSDPTIAPVLLIVLPIVAAGLSLAAGLINRRSGWWVALGTLVVETGLAVWLATAVYGGRGRLVHELGEYGRAGPDDLAVGIELVADELSAVVVVLIATVALGVLAVTRRLGPRGSAFYSGYLLFAGGLMGVSLTGDLFNMFVFLEIVGLSTYMLVASDRSAESAVAALKYLVIGTTGASLFLVGVGYLFLATGTLNMADLSAVLAGEPSFVDGPLYGDTLVIAGFGFVAVGLFVKSAIYPLHTWQPDAYAAAPDSVTVYISALASTVAAYAFARVSLTVFTPAFFEQVPLAATIVLAMAAVSIVAGSALAAMQRQIKRVFAYSSVSQFGLIVAGVAIAVHPAADATVPLSGPGVTAAEFALIGAVVHLVGHAIIKGGLFTAVTGIAAAEDARTIAEYAELGRRSPVYAAGMAVLALALVGVPPTVGFVGKWYIALGAVGAELWPIAAVILASTVLTLLYVGRLLERLYFTPHTPAAATEPVVPDGGRDKEDADGDSADGGGAGEGDRNGDDGEGEGDNAATPGGEGEADHDGEGEGDDEGEADHDGEGEGDDEGEADHDGEGEGDDEGEADHDGETDADLDDESDHDGGLIGAVEADRSSDLHLGIAAVLVAAAVSVVLLGFAGDWFAHLLDPFLEVLDQ